MKKKKRVGLIVWGAIITGLSGFPILGMLTSYQSGSINFDSFKVALYILVPICCGGIALLVLGIIKAAKVNNFNQSIDYDTVYVTKCFSCGTEVRRRIGSFIQRSGYPEGVVYCPGCHSALSFNDFTADPTLLDVHQTRTPNDNNGQN